jgi:serine/threonine-protein phosphatase 2A activator
MFNAERSLDQIKSSQMESTPATPPTRFPGAKAQGMMRRPDMVAGADLPADAAKGTPSKRIRTSADISAFAESQTHTELKAYLGRWAASIHLVPRSMVHPVKDPAAELPHEDAAGHPMPEAVRLVWRILTTMRRWMKEIPLQDMRQARFGNPAFRDFHERLRERAGDELIKPLVALRTGAAKDIPEDECVAELLGYLFDSFGNATRIDYGTGHELHFLIILFILEKMGVLLPESAPQQDSSTWGSYAAEVHYRQVALCLFWGYLELMRDVQKHFRMEPAGSHGVWGLDDFHHVPFIIGAAQLSAPAAASVEALGGNPAGTGPTPATANDGNGEVAATTAESSPPQNHREDGVRVPTSTIPPPSSIVDDVTVQRMRNDWIYFSMIAWIRDNKRGPFHEHSSVLYNVSGLEDWRRITGGMMKMYEGEVLHKINIVQHLLFGHHFPYPSVASPRA